MFDYRTATAQQVFNYVVLALVMQGNRSVDNNGMCLYRSPDGRKCAAGHLIPDSEYYPSMEGYRWTEAIDKGNEAAESCGQTPTLTKDKNALILALQTLHDNCKLDDDLHFDKVDFNSRCRQIAAKFGLDVTVLDNSDDRH